MRISGLYAITDPLLLPSNRLEDSVAAAIEGGASLVQYRDKTATPEEQLRRARRLARLCRVRGTLFLVNDDPALADAAGADGVHLGQRDGGIATARHRLGPRAVIGQTCHASLELAIEAERQGADYVALGRFFPSHTKPVAPPADLALLPQARARLTLPIVAIGGITVENAPSLLAAGADAIAVIHALFTADDIATRALAFSSLFPTPDRPVEPFA